MLVFALGTNFNMIDFDIFNRLINGNYFLSYHKILQNDFLSCLVTHKSFDPEWLVNILFSFTLKKFGVFGLNFLKCFLYLLSSISLVFLISKKKPNPIFFLVPLIFLINNSIFYLRCQIVTFIFLPIFLYFLEKIKSSPKIIYFVILSLLNILWQNCHGGFLISFIILFIYILADIFNKKPIKNYLILFVLLCATLLINPWGNGYFSFLFDSLITNRNYIAEWKSPLLFDIQGGKSYLIFAFCSFFLFIKKIIKNKNFDYCYLFLMTFFFIYSLLYFKFSTLYMIVALFCLSKYFSFKKQNNILNIIICICTAIYSLTIFINIPFQYSHIKAISRTVPVFPVEFLKINDLKGNIYAPFGISGYIAYKTYPNLKIFVDGRQEQVFSKEILKDNVDFMYQKNNKLLEKNTADYILCQKGLPYENYVKNSKKYKKIYEYGLYSIYSSDFLKNSYKIPNNDLFYYLDNIFVFGI